MEIYVAWVPEPKLLKDISKILKIDKLFEFRARIGAISTELALKTKEYP